MNKITANNTHRFDDIADTLYDAVKMSLIDKTIIIDSTTEANDTHKQLKQAMMQKFNARRARHGGFG